MAGEIKVLSAQGLLDNDPAFLTTLRDALTSQGVFHLSDCQLLFGDDAHCLDAAIAATKAFFALPTSEKQRFNRSKDRAAGFSDKELTKRIRDEKEVLDIAWTPHRDLPLDHVLNRCIDGYNIFPENVDCDKLLVYYASAVECICNPLMRAFCDALDMDYDAVKAATLDDQKSIGFMRLNYYARAGETMNIHEHTDAGLFTVLWANDIRGLEYEVDRKGGEGEPSFVRLDKLLDESLTLTVNVGDMFQVLTNGRVRAAKHRVICRPEFDLPRYSIALFINPSPSSIITPVADPAKRLYKSIAWSEFRRRRFEGDEEDQGQPEVQIADYLL